jgi:putative protease
MARDTNLEIEAFVHGAMCMAYSGRCLLSNFMTGRDSNRGMCCHPCRFQYAVVEEKRPGQYYHLHEDKHGTYIFNSKDLCMIEHIPQMIAAGITSLKIEGRMKGIHYLATVLKVYREAIDAYVKNPSRYHTDPVWAHELSKISHRGYSTGFYLGDPDQITPNRDGAAVKGQPFLAKVLSEHNDGNVLVDVRNRIRTNDRIEILSAHKPLQMDSIKQIYNLDQAEVEFAHPGTKALIRLKTDVSPYDMLRKVDV